MRILDQSGNVLSAMPADAVRVQSSLLTLTGMYVDSDGVIWNPTTGMIDEARTAAYAREMAMRKTSMPYVDFDAAAIKQESLQENQEAAYWRAYVDSMTDNIFTTAGEIPGNIYDATRNTVFGAMDFAKWLVVGLVAYAVIEVAGKVPDMNGSRKRARNMRKRLDSHVRKYRRRAAAVVRG